jgi:hypothetical protein
MAGAAHLPLLEESLFSLVRSWSHLPRLTVIADSGLSADKLRQALGWWPDDFRIETVDSMLNVAAGAGDLLARLAARSAVGRKFVATVLSARSEPTLYCDSDILWFDDPRTSIQSLLSSSAPVVLRASTDYQKCYDASVERVSNTSIADPPFVNSGLVFLRGDLIASTDLADCLIAAGDHYDHFAEQTLFAIATKQLAAPLWSASTVACFQSDDQSLRVTYKGKQWLARHYVGPVRHLFWRDALALRMGVRR